MGSLSGKHIVLGITGSIAAYKACYIIRLLIRQGAEVQTVITPSGKEFITPITLSALTSKPVISEFFSGRDGSWHSHVALGQWADAMLIAPCTASTIGKMANGIADNMLVTTYLSMKAPVFIAPAMDLDMFAHPTTRHNLDKLRSYGNIIIEPSEGELASGLVGKGRMEEPENIVSVLERYFSSDDTLSKKKVLITAGPTHERIDPVRFIGNDSTGKMGFALAEECASRGAEVTLVAGPVSLQTVNPGIRRIDVTTAQQMYETAISEFKDSDAAILCAAVADFTPEITSDSKIKRKGEMTLKLIPTKDIAASIGEIKKPGQVTAGFALETDDEAANAAGKLRKKNFDFIVLNSLRDAGAGFGHDTNKVTIIDRNGSTEYPLKSKKEVAKDIIDKLSSLLVCLLLLVLPLRQATAQELRANISINSTKISGTDKDVFTSLQTALTEFVNGRAWTNYKFAQQEKIDCSFSMTVNKYDAGSGAFECEMMVQSTRPVYGSAYNTTVFQCNDRQVNFNYTEQDRLEFSESNVDNNLTAIFAFYAYLIIGLDFDTMAENGGTEILHQAEDVVANAQSVGSGWRQFDDNLCRYAIITDYMNGSMEPFRKLQYVYHRKGLDDMSANAERGRAVISECMDLLNDAYRSKSTSGLPQLFTAIKREELVNVYSKGVDKGREKVAEILATIDPSNSKQWDSIKTPK